MKQTKAQTKAQTNGREVRYIDIDNLLPNPYQPETRVQVAPEVAKQFAVSIETHGLIQMPVVRPAKTDGKFEVGDGWLRRAGFCYLASNITDSPYRQMPCEVRDLTDQQMADLVMEANTVRKDLNPIELAKFYKRYLEEFGVTQQQLATKHNCSQGAIANSIRLLELPEVIQGKIISQEISETHGRELLRLNASPEMQKTMVTKIVSANYSVSEVGNVIAGYIYNNSKNLDPNEYPKPVFEPTECEKCANRQKLGSPYSSKKRTWRCLNPECYQKKEAKAEEDQRAKLAAEIQAAKDKVRAQNEKGKDKGKKSEKVAVIDCTKLTGRDYQELDNWRKIDNPAQCKTCASRAVGSFYGIGRTSAVCINLKCFRDKEKAYQTKQAVKARDEERKVTDRIKTACEQENVDGRVLKLVSESFQQHSRKDTREKVARLFGLKDANACFVVEDEKQLIRRVAAMVLMKEHLEGEKGLFCKMLAEFEGNSAELEKEIEAFRDKFCKTCEYEKEDKDESPGGCDLIMRVYPDRKCYRYGKRKKDKGDTQTPGTKSEDETLRESLPCDSCANAPSCARTFFVANESGGYSCDNKVATKVDSADEA